MPQVTFAPEDAASGAAVEGLEARLVAYEGAATPERSWTGPVTYYLVPGTYRVSLKANGYFDCVSSFQVPTLYITRSHQRHTGHAGHAGHNPSLG